MLTLAQEPLSSKINTCVFITIFYAQKKKKKKFKYCNRHLYLSQYYGYTHYISHWGGTTKQMNGVTEATT